MNENLPPIVRPTDMWTSDEGAQDTTESGNRETHMAIYHEFLKHNPGLTAREITRELEMPYETRRRLSDLKDEKVNLAKWGPSRKCSITGVTCMTWYEINHEFTQAEQEAIIEDERKREEKRARRSKLKSGYEQDDYVEEF